jgi:hypothetical protein
MLVIPVKLVLAFTRWSVSTRKPEGGERESRAILAFLDARLRGHDRRASSMGLPFIPYKMNSGTVEKSSSSSYNEKGRFRVFRDIASIGIPRNAILPDSSPLLVEEKGEENLSK